MHRALVGNLTQLGALLVREITIECNVPLDPIEGTFPGLTLGAIHRVDFGVAQANGHLAEAPSLPSRIQRDRH